MNIAVFASGNGSNFQAIADAVKAGRIKANLALLVCDNPQAYVLERAKKTGTEVFLAERKNFKDKSGLEAAIIKEVEKKKIGLIVLAGYMRLLSPAFVSRYKNKILNIHPALLPAFKGTEGIKDAFEYGAKIAGPTVHFVDEQTDHGPIVMQAAVMVDDDDTEETLAGKIHEQEHRIYPEAVRLFVEGKLKIAGRKVIIVRRQNGRQH